MTDRTDPQTDTRTEPAEPISRAAVTSTAIPWTAEEDATLTDLWGQNLSAPEIGARLNRNKNQVLGRAHRLKLPPKARPLSPARPRKPRPPSERPGVKAAVLADHAAGVVDPRVMALKHGVHERTVKAILQRAGVKLGYRQTTLPSASRPRASQWGASGVTEAAPKTAPVHYTYEADPTTLRSDVGGSRRHCQFIPGHAAGVRTLYCAKPVHRGAYCLEHAAICFRVHAPSEPQPVVPSGGPASGDFASAVPEPQEQAP